MNPAVLFDRPPPVLEISNEDAHVFCAWLDDHAVWLDQFAKTLSADEHERASRFVFKRDRDRFITGRGLLRQTLAWLLHADPAQLDFAYGDHGKPHLRTPIAGRYLHFNVAHSDDLVVYIVSARSQVGIDVERLRPIPEMAEIVSQFFSAKDKSGWQSQPAGKRAEFFFNRWTQMEAFLKAIGSGLDQPRSTSPDVTEQADWFFHSISPASGYTVTTATKHAELPRCWAL